MDTPDREDRLADLYAELAALSRDEIIETVRGVARQWIATGREADLDELITLLRPHDPVLAATLEEERKDADMAKDRTQAWGKVERTKSKAIESAADALRRLETETRRTRTSSISYDEVRPTPTGYQARVSADTRPGRKVSE